MTEGQPPQPMDYGTSKPTDYQGPPPDEDSKNMGMLCHLLAIVMPFLGPLIIWIMKKDSSPFVNDQGKEALNFQITMFIIAFVVALTCLVGIGVFLMPFVGIANVVFCIMAGLEARKGVAYRYPFAIRLIK